MVDPWTQWPADPGVLLGLGSLTLVYALAATVWRRALIRRSGTVPDWTPVGMQAPEVRGQLTPWQVMRFFGGIIVATSVLASPLHTIGESYLLSAHMVQHLVVTLVVPPLLLSGIPAWMLRPLLTWRPVTPVVRLLLNPVAAFLLFNVVFLGWHAPQAYEMALATPEIHALEHVSMILTAALAWWPVYGMLWEYPRLPYGGQVLYLFLQSLPPTVFGALLSLTSVLLYPTYELAPRISYLSAAHDQIIAGLIMWLPGALGYFVVLTVVFFIWVEQRAASGGEAPYRKVDPNRVRAKRLADAT